MRKIYYADFETTRPNEVGKVQVYIWVILAGDKVYKGRKINTFIKLLKSFKNAIIFFHNLKYDFSYIHHYLIENNIECKVLEKSEVIYSAKFFNVELRDSMNFLPMSLDDVGKNYCVKYKKGSIDYEVPYDHYATKKEIDYCVLDCRVLEEGMTIYMENLEKILIDAKATNSAKKVWKKLTNAGVSFEAFRELSDFDLVCPKTTQAEYNLYRQAYRGGYVYSRPCGIVSNVQMIDCNSMYPYMYSTIPMPYGTGYTCKTEKELNHFKFYIIGISIKFELKEGYIPIIGGSFGRFGNIEYRSSSNGEFEYLVVSNKDFELIKLFYNCEYNYVWGVGFDTKEKFFKKYADTFIEVKNKEKGIKRAVAKVLLNSPYGKLAENGVEETYEYIIEEGTVKRVITGYKLEEERFQYLPMAIAITSAARYYLLTTALSIGFDKVYYMDTDSIKFFDMPVSFKFDPNILGAWKDEGKAVLFKTISPKKYGYYDGNTINFKCAGFPQKTLEKVLKNGQKVSYAEAKQLLTKFDKGLSMWCLQSKLMDGGRVLTPILKEIK